MRILSLFVLAFVIGCGPHSSRPPGSDPSTASGPTETIAKVNTPPAETKSAAKVTTAAENATSQEELTPLDRQASAEPTAVPAWIADLVSENLEARTQAERNLEALGDRAKPQLLAALRDDSAAVRRGAAFTLLAMFDPRDAKMVTAFTSALTDDDRTVRHIALQAVKDLPAADLIAALPRLAEMLDSRHESEANRGEVARLIGSLESDAQSVLPALIRAAREDPSGKVRSACLFSVSRVADAAAVISVCQDALNKDSDPGVRAVAATRLGRAGSAAAPAIADLGRALEDKQDSVRRAAAGALIRIGPLSVPVLVQQLESKDPRAREWAVFALGNLGSAAQPAIPALKKRLADDDQAVRQLTEAVLRHIPTDH